MQSAKVTTQPAVEPVTVSEAKLFMRVDSSADDTLIGDLITCARQLAEEYTRRKFINTGITLTMDSLPHYSSGQWWDGVREGSMSALYGTDTIIRLPFPPTVSVTSLTTYGLDNSASVFSSSNYRVDTTGARIYLNDNAQWPVNLRNYNAVEVVYIAGYGATAADVPASIRQAIKSTVAAMYEDRTCMDMPAVAMQALQMYRVITEGGNGV